MKWRLLLDDPQDAATNMAVDEALFHSALSGTSLPTVRLYRWSRPSLSIGFRQVLHEVCDIHECARLGIDVVRRISGGRALLHHQELTYCVCAASTGDLRGLSVREVYSRVSGALRAALQSLPIHLDPPQGRTTSSQVDRPELPCLAVPTGHEITCGGRKLVGSAQKWNRRGFLQHGSIILGLDVPLWLRATGLPPQTNLGAVGLNELLTNRAGSVNLTALCRAIESAFESFFNESCSDRQLSAAERRLADTLAHQKYSSRAWNVARQSMVSIERQAL